MSVSPRSIYGLLLLLGAPLMLPGLSGVSFAAPNAPPASAGSGSSAGSGQGTAGVQTNQAQAPSSTDAKKLDRLIVSASDLTLQGVNGASFAPLPKDGTRVSPFLIKAEVLLDRAHASPGVIDGLAGQNYEKAVAVFEVTHGLPVDGKLTAQVWGALGRDQAPILVQYTITQDDVAGPFTPHIPTDYAEMAKLPQLGYRDEAEMFSARFHMDKGLLATLNPGADMTRPGTKIIVAQVTRAPLSGRIDHIDVDKANGQVRAYDGSGKLMVAYPATVGSEDLPSPSGTHRVKGVARHPVYSYNPQKNFQQGHNTKPLTIPAGPNNPVGIVYIALSKPTYGIHGTPEPSKIDKTTSHGCVRLTNWDAQELAGLVKPGIRVHFLDEKS